MQNHLTFGMCFFKQICFIKTVRSPQCPWSFPGAGNLYEHGNVFSSAPGIVSVSKIIVAKKQSNRWKSVDDGDSNFDRMQQNSSNTSILNLHSCLEREKHIQKQIPIRIMHGIFTYIWLTFMVNVGKYMIHGSLIIWYRTHIFHLHVCLKWGVWV